MTEQSLEGEEGEPSPWRVVRLEGGNGCKAGDYLVMGSFSPQEGYSVKICDGCTLWEERLLPEQILHKLKVMGELIGR